jgi:hypothetical protein
MEVDFRVVRRAGPCAGVRLVWPSVFQRQPAEVAGFDASSNNGSLIKNSRPKKETIRPPNWRLAENVGHFLAT